MTHIAVMALGSLGDVNPFLGIATELVRRGHRVTFITNPFYEDWVTAAGLPFRPLGSKDEFAKQVDNPHLWDQNRAMEMIFRIAADWSEDGYRTLEALTREGVSLVVAPFQCFGARVAQEKLGLRSITVMTNPILAESAHDPCHYPVLQFLSRSGPVAARALYAILNFFFEMIIRPGVNRCRRNVGLEPKFSLGHWVWSPDLVIGLWPAFLRDLQPDSMKQLKLTGFIVYDGPAADGATLAIDDDFLAQRPIVFTAGTANTQGRAFFAAALDAAKILKHSTLFLTKFPGQLPSDLPDYVRVLSYAPFAALLPRCSAIVHHGGIGTLARALQAGVPQLIVPSAHDQFDNAHLLKRLGVAASSPWKKPSGAEMAKQLGSLLSSPAVREQCATYARALAGRDALAETCDLIEAQLRP